MRRMYYDFGDIKRPVPPPHRHITTDIQRYTRLERERERDALSCEMIIDILPISWDFHQFD